MSLNLLRWQLEVFIKTTAKYNIIPAGRRTGKTQGGVGADIIKVAKGETCLWVDTVYGNIDRYVQRYFIPMMDGANLEYDYNGSSKILKIGEGYCDFRSADKPENIEGFGYDNIFLNEAGIILNNDYLYTNAILPMLLDNKDSQLFAFGTPKGKINKKGESHKYWELWQSVLKGERGFAGRQLTSYDNPLLDKEAIKDLEAEMRKMGEEAVQQEIYGQFVDQSEDKVFNSAEFEYFKLEDIDHNRVEARLAAIDVADEGTDFYSMPIGYLIGTKIYIVDWLFSKENTNYTIPATSDKILQHRLDYCAIETNNHGSVVYKQIEQGIGINTTLIPVNQRAKKHSRIIQNAGFMRDNFLFRSDYEVGSDYDIAMKQVFGYSKDGKAPHDDAPDSAACLSAVARDLFGQNWFS